MLYYLIHVNVYFLAGTVSDGEFCSLRTQGETRALHVWQLIHDAKESVKKKSKATLLEMLILTHCKHLLGIKMEFILMMNNKHRLSCSVWYHIHVRLLSCGFEFFSGLCSSSVAAAPILVTIITQFLLWTKLISLLKPL